MRFYGDIQKVDAEQRMVWGYASTEAADDDGESVTLAAMEGALDDYMKFANVREMHQLSAVGTTKQATVDDKGIYVAAHVVDDDAWEKVQTGVYKGFSIGGKRLARDPLNRKVITKVKINEISLVDRPCNPETVFDVWKAADAAQSQESEMTDKTAAAAGETKPVAVTDAAAAAAGAVQTAEQVAAAATGAQAAPAEPAVVEKAAGTEVQAEATPPDPAARADAAITAAEAAVAKAAVTTDLAKGMYTVRSLAELLSTLSYLVSDAESEAELEGDNSKVPAKLRAALNGLGQTFKDMAAEEVTELLAVGTTRKAAEADTLRKAPVDETLTPEALAKVIGERDDLAKRLADRDDQLTKVAERVEPLAKAVEGLTERLARIEAAPLPAKTAANALAKAVTKEEDTTGQLGNADKPQLSNEDVQKALAAMSPEDRAMTLTKAALARPISVTTR